MTSKKTFMPYKAIAKFLNKSYYYVHRICDQLKKPAAPIIHNDFEISLKKSG